MKQDEISLQTGWKVFKYILSLERQMHARIHTHTHPLCQKAKMLYVANSQDVFFGPFGLLTKDAPPAIRRKKFPVFQGLTSRCRKQDTGDNGSPAPRTHTHTHTPITETALWQQVQSFPPKALGKQNLGNRLG